MDHLAILRTVNHGSGDHTKGNHWMLTGYEGPDFNASDNEVQRRPSMRSAVARLKGAGLAPTGLPPYVAVPHLRGGTDNLFSHGMRLDADGPDHRPKQPARRKCRPPADQPPGRRRNRLSPPWHRWEVDHV